MIVSQLVSMDIPKVRAERAAWATKNAGVDAAINWYFEHQGDPGNLLKKILI